MAKTEIFGPQYTYIYVLCCARNAQNVLVLVLVLYSIGTSTGTVQYFVLSSIYFSKHKCIIYSINCIIIGASFVRFFKVGSGIKPKYFWQRIYELLHSIFVA